MTGNFHQLWVYLETTPLLWLTATLLAYQGAAWLNARAQGSPLCNPVLIAATAVVALLMVSDTDYQTYFSGAQFVHFLLGPATVALAVPLHGQLPVLRRSFLAISLSILVAAVVAAGSSVGIAWLLGGSPRILLSLAPKSVTMPIAMSVSENIGGLPSLTSSMVLLTGISGGIFGLWLLDRLKVTDEVARGLAMGASAHGVGTAQAMRDSPVSGAFAGLAMGLNGLATALLLPALAGLFQ